MKPIFSSEGLHCTDCLAVVTTYENLSSFQKECEKGNRECLAVWCKECRDKMEETKCKNLLWLDDLRNPHEGKWIEEFAPEYLNSGSIIWVLNYEEFIEKSDAYMRSACKRLGATHFAGSSADVDLFCAIKAKTFIQGRGFFLSLLWK